MTDHDKQERARAVSERADALTSRALETTIAVYDSDYRDLPDAVGSAVLMAVGGTRFLISAAHVLKRLRTRQLYAPLGDRLIQITGESTRAFAEGTSEEDDHVDLWFVRLDGPEWISAPDSRFVGWREIDHLDQPRARDAFALLGYPTTKQRNQLCGHELRAQCFRLMGLEGGPEQYAIYHRDPHISLMLGFDKRRVWGSERLETAPDLEGTSGGAVWRLTHGRSVAIDPPTLTAVIIEWHRRTAYKYVLATRLQPILQMLAAKYPDIKDAVRSGAV